MFERNVSVGNRESVRCAGSSIVRVDGDGRFVGELYRSWAKLAEEGCK